MSADQQFEQKRRCTTSDGPTLVNRISAAKTENPD
jgi:hypothetical protein